MNRRYITLLLLLGSSLFATLHVSAYYKSVSVNTAGNLQNIISESEKYSIDELYVSGRLNGTDFRFLREMAGRDKYGNTTSGILKILDISNARIVSGGENYVEIGNVSYTVSQNNVIPPYVFHDCNLTKIVVPSSVTIFENEAFEDCKYLTSVNIPSGVTTIGTECFNGCTSLKNITFPSTVIRMGNNALSNTAWLDSKPSGQVVYAGYVAFCFKGGLGDVTSITFSSDTKGIADYAFENRDGLKNITFPSSLQYIGTNAFAGCKTLTYITSNVNSPFAISDNVFDNTVYSSAILFVPNGKSGTYSRTSGWSNFSTIIDDSNPRFPYIENGISYELNKSSKTATINKIEAEDEDITIPSTIYFNNYSYTINALGNNIFQGASEEKPIKSVTFPSTIKTVSDNAFQQFGALAIVWNSNTYLPSTSFNTSDYRNSNFLLYVNSSSYAPSGVSNVVVNGKASQITLKDGHPFYCPQSFTAQSISYTHRYSMESGVGECAGWESIALPFNVSKITHDKGTLVTFSNYSFDPNSIYRPFWLYSLSSSGFKRASSIQANTPYIICMPNNRKYTDMYNLSGTVTFSSTNVTVSSTTDYNLKTVTYDGAVFTPNYMLYSSSNSYALNVDNDYVTNSDSSKPGSVFINSYRTIYPFEARFDTKSNARKIEIIFAEDEKTDIDDVIFSPNDGKEVKIYSLSGHMVGRASQKDFESIWSALPKGVYIVDGKKLVK